MLDPIEFAYLITQDCIRVGLAAVFYLASKGIIKLEKKKRYLYAYDIKKNLTREKPWIITAWRTLHQLQREDKVPLTIKNLEKIGDDIYFNHYSEISNKLKSMNYIHRKSGDRLEPEISLVILYTLVWNILSLFFISLSVYNAYLFLSVIPSLLAIPIAFLPYLKPNLTPKGLGIVNALKNYGNRLIEKLTSKCKKEEIEKILNSLYGKYLPYAVVLDSVIRKLVSKSRKIESVLEYYYCYENGEWIPSFIDRNQIKDLRKEFGSVLDLLDGITYTIRHSIIESPAKYGSDEIFSLSKSISSFDFDTGFDIDFGGGGETGFG